MLVEDQSSTWLMMSSFTFSNLKEGNQEDVTSKSVYNTWTRTYSDLELVIGIAIIFTDEKYLT